MTRAIPLLPIVAVLACWPIVMACAQDPTPVEIGGDAERDACGSVGRIARLDPADDNLLSVRAGPGPRHRERDRSGLDALVTICDERGPWLGVVYPTREGEVDCGVSSPRPTRTPDRGPCRSGWVHRGFVEMVAG